jgi:hypothetical protein
VSRVKHMAAHRPMLQTFKKVLANSEPSTHGVKQTWPIAVQMSALTQSDIPVIWPQRRCSEPASCALPHGIVI